MSLTLVCDRAGADPAGKPSPARFARFRRSAAIVSAREFPLRQPVAVPAFVRHHRSMKDLGRK
jgi:hypothetical protein